MPFGNGVFITKDWIHCGTVKNGIFTGTNKLSVSRQYDELRLVKQMKLPDSSLLQKFESFRQKSYQTDFYINKVRDTEVN